MEGTVRLQYAIIVMLTILTANAQTWAFDSHKTEDDLAEMGTRMTATSFVAQTAAARQSVLPESSATAQKSEAFTTSAIQTIIGIGTSPAEGARSSLVHNKPRLVIQRSLLGFAMTASPNGHLLITGSSDGTVLVWERSSGRQVLSFQADSSMIDSLLVSPDGTQLVTTSGLSTLSPKVWDLATGRLVHSFTGGGTKVLITPDGRFLLSWESSGSSGKLWDFRTGKSIDIGTALEQMPPFYSDFMQHAYEVSVTPDGRFFLLRSYSSVRMYDVTSGAFIKEWDLGHKDATVVLFLPDLRTVLVGDEQGQLLSVRLGLYSPEQAWVVDAHTAPIQTLSLTADGSRVITDSREGNIKVWDIQTGREVGQFPNSVSPVVVPNSDLVATLDFMNDQKIRQWRMSTLQIAHTLESTSRRVAFLALADKNQRLISVDQDETVYQWDLATGSVERLHRGVQTTFRHLGAEGMQAIPHSPDAPHGGLSVEALIGMSSSESEKDLRRKDVIVAVDGQAVSSLSTFQDVLSRLAPGSRVPVDVRRAGEPLVLKLQLEEQPLFRMPTTMTSTAEGHLLLSTRAQDGAARIVDLHDHTERVLQAPDASIADVALVAQGRYAVTMGYREGDYRLWDAASGTMLHRLDGRGKYILAAGIGPDGELIVVGSKGMMAWDIKSGGPRLLRVGEETVSDMIEAVISEDGKILVLAQGDKGAGSAVTVWDLVGGKKIGQLEFPIERIYTVALSPDKKVLLIGSIGRVAINERIFSLRPLAHLSSWSESMRFFHPLFTKDSRYLITTAIGHITGTTSDVINIYDTKKNAAILHLHHAETEQWTAVDREGRFDTNSLERTQGLQWVLPSNLPSNPFHALPVESFMRHYYEPGLLSRILNGDELPPVPPLTSLNVEQPKVTITSILPEPNGPGRVALTLTVTRPAGKCHRPGGRMAPNEARDLQLFRNGQLVAYAPAQDGPLPFTPGQDIWTHTFHDLRLPAGSGTTPVEFTAYAFNCDQVRSTLDSQTYTPTPSPSAALKGLAYVILVGVNIFQNDLWNLEFSANDAQAMQDIFVPALKGSGRFRDVVSLRLTSPTASPSGTASVAAATKANIETALARLAGKPVQAERLRAIPGVEQLAQAQPADTVVLYFSTHGYRDSAGTFFLFPQDLGSGKTKDITEDLLAHAISSTELSHWLRDVDAGEWILLIDACNSAAAVQGSAFKPGPFGSRGLGQLSYDKAMRVLAASQAEAQARAHKLTQLGLLTYALLKEGLERRTADFRPVDDTITVGEWLQYGLHRVPKLTQELLSGRTIPKGTDADEPAGADADASSFHLLQHPALFDFSAKTHRPDQILMRLP